MQRRAVLGCATTLLGGIVGYNAVATEPSPQSNRTQQPPAEVRTDLPEPIAQRITVTVKKRTDENVQLQAVTTLIGDTETPTPRQMVLQFNGNDTLQDKAVISDPQFGKSITRTLSGDIGPGEEDVSLSSHTDFKPHGSLSLHYTKLLPEQGDPLQF